MIFTSQKKEINDKKLPHLAYGDNDKKGNERRGIREKRSPSRTKLNCGGEEGGGILLVGGYTYLGRPWAI